MDLQECFVGVTGKGTLATHVSFSECERFTDSKVARLAAIHQIHRLDMDLLDVHVERTHLVQQAVNLRFRQPSHPFLHNSIKLHPQLTGRLDQLSALDGQFGLALLQPIKLLFQLAKVHAGLVGLSISCRQCQTHRPGL